MGFIVGFISFVLGVILLFVAMIAGTPNQISEARWAVIYTLLYIGVPLACFGLGWVFGYETKEEETRYLNKKIREVTGR